MSKGGPLRFAITERDLEKLLRTHAPDKKASSELQRLILELQLAADSGAQGARCHGGRPRLGDRRQGLL